MLDRPSVSVSGYHRFVRYFACLNIGKICSYRLGLCTWQASRDLSRSLLLDRFPSPESFVTKISLELALCSKKTRHLYRSSNVGLLNATFVKL